MKKGVEKEPSKAKKVFSIIFRILNIALGFFFLYLAFIFVIYEFNLRLYLCLVTALFAFLPKKITRVKTWVKFIIIVVMFILIIVVSRIAVYQANNNLIYHDMQESFTLGGGDYSIIVYDIENYTSVKFGNETKTTEGYFIFVNGRITNLLKSSTNLSPTYILMDNQNNTYPGIGSNGFDTSFQPSLEKNVSFVFEIPRTAQGIKLLFEEDRGIYIVNLNI